MKMTLLIRGRWDVRGGERYCFDSKHPEASDFPNKEWFAVQLKCFPSLMRPGAGTSDGFRFFQVIQVESPLFDLGTIYPLEQGSRAETRARARGNARRIEILWRFKLGSKWFYVWA